VRRQETATETPEEDEEENGVKEEEEEEEEVEGTPPATTAAPLLLCANALASNSLGNSWACMNLAFCLSIVRLTNIFNFVFAVLILIPFSNNDDPSTSCPFVVFGLLPRPLRTLCL
jgi:hypothetical protein